MYTGFVIEGAKELERNLKTLGSRVQKKVARKAVREALRPLQRQARANAMALSRAGRMGPLLEKHIVIRAPKEQQRGTYALHVMMRPGVDQFRHATRDGQDYYIPAAIEYGHGPSKEGSARPFMRPAADSTRQQAKRMLAEQLRIGILREAIKGRYQ